MAETTPDTQLTWINVAIGLLFIVFDAVLSGVLGLGIGTSLMVAAARCILQLSVMSLVLGKVFESHNIFAVAGIALLLNVLGAIETTFNKAKRRYTNMVSRSCRWRLTPSSPRSCCPWCAARSRSRSSGPSMRWRSIRSGSRTSIVSARRERSERMYGPPTTKDMRVLRRITPPSLYAPQSPTTNTQSRSSACSSATPSRPSASR